MAVKKQAKRFEGRAWDSLFGIGLLAFAYGLVSYAIDSGSAVAYLAAIASLVGSVHFIKKAIKK